MNAPDGATAAGGAITTDAEETARTRAFYDDLSADYHRIFPDWEAALRWQGATLHAVLTAGLGAGPLRILDAACGIGTQLIGLALHGHTMTGCDLSFAAVELARRECARLGVTAQLDAGDMRALSHPDAAFDAVVCADNSLPHLLTVDHVLSALRGMHRVLRPGGMAVVTTRDYDALAVERPTTTPVQRSQDAQGLRSVTTQLWDWAEDGETYVLTHLMTWERSAGQWVTVGREATYRAWQRAELSALAEEAGFVETQWLSAEQSGYYQPMLLLRRV